VFIKAFFSLSAGCRGKTKKLQKYLKLWRTNDLNLGHPAPTQLAQPLLVFIGAFSFFFFYERWTQG
jgi:hypothetical protein